MVQNYGGQPVPGWVTEGIADYVRWFCYEPPSRRPRVNPRRAKYTDGYRTTAALFDWIVRTKSSSFVRRLNEAARTGKYSDALFQHYAGRPLDDLWAEFIESLTAKKRIGPIMCVLPEAADDPLPLVGHELVAAIDRRGSA